MNHMTYTTEELLTDTCHYTTVPEIKDQDLIKYIITGTSQTDISLIEDPADKIKGYIKSMTNTTEKPLTDTWHDTTRIKIKDQNSIEYNISTQKDNAELQVGKGVMKGTIFALPGDAIPMCVINGVFETLICFFFEQFPNFPFRDGKVAKHSTI